MYWSLLPLLLPRLQAGGAHGHHGLQNARPGQGVPLPPPPPSSEEMLLPVVDTVNPKLTLVRSASEAVGTH